MVEIEPSGAMTVLVPLPFGTTMLPLLVELVPPEPPVPRVLTAGPRGVGAI